MHPFRYDGTSWSPGVRVRPVIDEQSSDVEVADTVTGRRFRISPEMLAELILTNGGERLRTANQMAMHEACAPSDEVLRLISGWRHWRARGWHPSDQYYVASRRWQYADTVDPEGLIRTTTVERYLETDGPPMEEAHRDGPKFPLGEPAQPGLDQISQLLVTRRSGRAYTPKPVSLDRLSGLLWYGFADVRKRRERTDENVPLSYLDSYGSAWDIYLCAYNVAGVAPGVYRYELADHQLTNVRPGDHRTAMVDVLQGMHSPATAAWTLGLVADFPRYQWRYRHEHGLRRLYLESGILGQELIILAMSYGLGTLVTPAQSDRAYLALHDLPADRYAPVYTLTMGWSRGGAGVEFHYDSVQRRPVAGRSSDDTDPIEE